MSITINDIMQLPTMKDAIVVAGHSGMNNIVTSISVMESADEENLGFEFPGVSNSYRQEIMITAFMEARNDVEKQCNAVRRLYAEGEIGIIIFYVGYVLPDIDPQLISVADELEMPLIVMPSNLSLRYGDTIFDVLRAVFEDRKKDGYFAQNIIHRLSRLDSNNRSINVVLSMVSDQTQCSIILLDELGLVLNKAAWPLGRELDIPSIVSEISNTGILYGNIDELYLNGQRMTVNVEVITVGLSKLTLIIIKEAGDLMDSESEQIKFIVSTYINLWTDNYGVVDTKQLISAIISNEPEKMRRIAGIIGIDVKSLSAAYFFYLDNSAEDENALSHIKNVLKEMLSNIDNNMLIDVFNETIAVMLDRRRTMIDDYLSYILTELSEKGYECRVIVCNPLSTTKQVKDSYWMYHDFREYIPLIFRNKNIITISEIEYIKKLSQQINQENFGGFLRGDLLEMITGDSNGVDLIETLSTYLLDTNMNIELTAQVMFVHKNTIKYRLKKIEKILGHKINKAPEINDLFAIAGLYRLHIN